MEINNDAQICPYCSDGKTKHFVKELKHLGIRICTNPKCPVTMSADDSKTVLDTAINYTPNIHHSNSKKSPSKSPKKVICEESSSESNVPVKNMKEMDDSPMESTKEKLICTSCSDDKNTHYIEMLDLVGLLICTNDECSLVIPDDEDPKMFLAGIAKEKAIIANANIRDRPKEIKNKQQVVISDTKVSNIPPQQLSELKETRHEQKQENNPTNIQNAILKSGTQHVSGKIQVSQFENSKQIADNHTHLERTKVQTLSLDQLTHNVTKEKSEQFQVEVSSTSKINSNSAMSLSEEDSAIASDNSCNMLENTVSFNKIASNDNKTMITDDNSNTVSSIDDSHTINIIDEFNNIISNTIGCEKVLVSDKPLHASVEKSNAISCIDDSNLNKKIDDSKLNKKFDDSNLNKKIDDSNLNKKIGDSNLNKKIDDSNTTNSIDDFNTIDSIDNSNTINSMNKYTTINKVDASNTVNKINDSNTVRKIDDCNKIDVSNMIIKVYDSYTVNKINDFNTINIIDATNTVNSTNDSNTIDNSDAINSTDDSNMIVSNQDSNVLFPEKAVHTIVNSDIPHIVLNDNKTPDITAFISGNERQVEECNSLLKIRHIMWENNKNLCWLNSSLHLLAHNSTVRAFEDDCIVKNIAEEYQKVSNIINQKSLSGYKLQIARKKMTAIQNRALKYLGPLIKCKTGIPDSSFCAMLNLINESKVCRRLFEVRFTWKFVCKGCNRNKIQTFKKTVITLSKVDLFNPVAPLTLCMCPECKMPDQERQLSYLSTPKCLMFHFENGAGTGLSIPEDFSLNNQKYSMTGVILLKNLTANLNHFLTWIRSPENNYWLECDDLKKSAAFYCQKNPQINLNEVHIITYERNGDPDCIESPSKYVNLNTNLLKESEIKKEKVEVSPHGADTLIDLTEESPSSDLKNDYSLQKNIDYYRQIKDQYNDYSRLFNNAAKIEEITVKNESRKLSPDKSNSYFSKESTVENAFLKLSPNKSNSHSNKESMVENSSLIFSPDKSNNYSNKGSTVENAFLKFSPDKSNSHSNKESMVEKSSLIFSPNKSNSYSNKESTVETASLKRSNSYELLNDGAIKNKKKEQTCHVYSNKPTDKGKTFREHSPVPLEDSEGTKEEFLEKVMLVSANGKRKRKRETQNKDGLKPSIPPKSPTKLNLQLFKNYNEEDIDKLFHNKKLFRVKKSVKKLKGKVPLSVHLEDYVKSNVEESWELRCLTKDDAITKALPGIDDIVEKYMDALVKGVLKL